MPDSDMKVLPGAAYFRRFAKTQRRTAAGLYCAALLPGSPLALLLANRKDYAMTADTVCIYAFLESHSLM